MSRESDYAWRMARFYGPERVQWSRDKRVEFCRNEIARLESEAAAKHVAHKAGCVECQKPKGFCIESLSCTPEDIESSRRVDFLRGLIWHEEQDALYAERARLRPVDYRNHIDGFCRYWQNLRYRKFEAMGRKCERCGKLAQLDAHHLHYDTLGFEELCDLQALCRGCHERTHRGGRIERLRQFVQHRE